MFMQFGFGTLLVLVALLLLSALRVLRDVLEPHLEPLTRPLPQRRLGVLHEQRLQVARQRRCSTCHRRT